MRIEPHVDMRGWFRERLISAFRRRGVSTRETTEFYLVELLASQARVSSEVLLRPLVERLADALETPDPALRLRQFREMGDSALYVLGFFSDHLERRGVSRSYVGTMGGRAYGAARDLIPLAPSSAEQSMAEAFDELADGFLTFADVLDDVRESTALRTPQDIVRLYDRWRRTRSPVLAERLRAEGVFPQAPEKPTLH